MSRVPNCPLCEADGGELAWMGDRARVILVEHGRFPGFCRVVWNDHAAELTDLDDADQAWLMRLVARVERVVREVMTPDKVNLAAFGNMVPHLHWHIIPRYRWDTHFPEAVWAAPQRAADAARIAELGSRLPALRTALSMLTDPD
ncbi:Diadenosine tetraphosphate (Ap4A) hydrolase [Ralstonia sp. 25mfcol4.1]|uniref:HIT family protein n=1 Tax=Burkholderiaceae TaxID=119060 RepID=UPI0008910396|nr:HIT family protein [Ralstonia sp. 25mfcol4.1]SDO85812.1 Diadenosine tetraphosphate (Ap4A) hydrolase [Ralstonia sp. 25mfcol4.1]